MLYCDIYIGLIPVHIEAMTDEVEGKERNNHSGFTDLEEGLSSFCLGAHQTQPRWTCRDSLHEASGLY